MNKKYIIGGVIIVVLLIWAGISFRATLTPYVSIEEAVAMEKRVQVAGYRVDSGQFDIKTNMFTFKLQDDNGKILRVVFDGAKPGNFDQATQVVCKGVYKDGIFHADDILVKCPSKYQEAGAEA